MKDFLTCSLIRMIYGCIVIVFATMFVSCEQYDLDEKLPPDFGSTIYNYLQDGDYTDFVRLVDELGYAEALEGKSLKTMFVANNEAFERFYRSNKWGVKSYEDLSMAQKKMLLYSAMIDNSLQIMNLSSTSGAEGPIEGNCMRRSTAASVYDSVPVLYANEMPENNPHWNYYRSKDSIICMKDMTTAPIIFFVEGYLANHSITNSDVNFLFNNSIQREAGDASINDVMVEEPNIRCANGFIHRMADVLTPLENMAEILRTKPNTTIYSRLVERFSAPYYAGRESTDSYNFEYGTNIDSLFKKGYFSERSAGGTSLGVLPDGTAVESKLKFDPGWNSFFSDDPNATSSTIALQQNMGVMLVPGNQALETYWNEGVGKVLKKYYHVWDSVPDNVIAKLINNNMLNSFSSSVPGKFESIVNSTKDQMGITVNDIDSVYLGCNGAIYLTNKVFSPTEYISVLFPALVSENMRIFYWGVEQLEYGSYLNSLDSYYSLFVPTNNSMLCYIDPISYKESKTQLFKFHYDKNVESERDRVWASVFEYDMETGKVGDSLREERNSSNILSRLQDVLDNHIVVGNIESGKEFYRTKNGGVVRVFTDGSTISGVQGTLQENQGVLLAINEFYDESSDGNGKTYIVDEQPILTTRKSVFDVLSEHEEFSIFYNLMAGSELYETSRKGYSSGSPEGNVAVFNNYHYTVYVPVNSSLESLVTSGKLPTWNTVAEMEENPDIPEEQIEDVKEQINNFLRYHIQDNSLYVGMEYSSTRNGGVDSFERDYETAIIDTVSSKFYTLNVKMEPTAISLTDRMGNKRKVLTDNAVLYNLSAREYQFSGSTISTSAFAVVQPIDGPLYYKKDQFK